MGDLGKFRELAPFWAPTVLLVNRQTGSKSPKLARGQNLRARPDRPETLQIDEEQKNDYCFCLSIFLPKSRAPDLAVLAVVLGRKRPLVGPLSGLPCSPETAQNPNAAWQGAQGAARHPTMPGRTGPAPRLGRPGQPNAPKTPKAEIRFLPFWAVLSRLGPNTAPWPERPVFLAQKWPFLD